MSNIFFCADHHFGHRAIIDLDNRPYSSVEQMDEDLIEIHNKIVGKNDAVYFLGDLSFNQSFNKYKELFTRMNGKKFYILGNHDNKQHLIRCQKEGLLLDVRESKILNIGKETVHLTHYPLHEWFNFHKNGIHLHAHTHGNMPEYMRSADVGIRNWEYGPVEFLELKQYIDSNCTDNIHPKEYI